MNTYFLSITVIGMAALGMTWIPTLTKKIHISYSIIYLLFGVVMYLLVDELPWPNPFQMQTTTVHLTELIVIIALMGTGLKIDHPFSFRLWGGTLSVSHHHDVSQHRESGIFKRLATGL